MYVRGSEVLDRGVVNMLLIMYEVIFLLKLCNMCPKQDCGPEGVDYASLS